jgi:hypothetical protein
LSESEMSGWYGDERRREPRVPMSDTVRLFVIGPDGEPVAERFCAGVDQNAQGISVRTPGTLDPGVRVIVMNQGEVEPRIWLACVAHVQICQDGTRVLGLERIDMCEQLARTPWMSVLRSAA